jgi:hypothetical protein
MGQLDPSAVIARFVGGFESRQEPRRTGMANDDAHSEATKANDKTQGAAFPY